MKTLTEFAALTLKNALSKKQELTSAGKTAEELPAALGEALKLEGDKLAFMIAALDMVGEKTHDLKRVLVSALNEGENAPSSAKLIGEKYYTVEYYPPVHKAGADKQAPAAGGRDGAGGGRRDGKGGRGGKGGGRNDRGGGGSGRDGGGRGPGGPGGSGPRSPKPAQLGGTGKLPVPNKTTSTPPVANKTEDKA